MHSREKNNIRVRLFQIYDSAVSLRLNFQIMSCIKIDIIKNGKFMGLIRLFNNKDSN